MPMRVPGCDRFWVLLKRKSALVSQQAGNCVERSVSRKDALYLALLGLLVSNGQLRRRWPTDSWE